MLALAAEPFALANTVKDSVQNDAYDSLKMSSPHKSPTGMVGFLTVPSQLEIST